APLLRPQRTYSPGRRILGKLGKKLPDRSWLHEPGFFARKKYTGQTTGRQRGPGVPGGILQCSQSRQLCNVRCFPPGLCGNCERGSAACDGRGYHQHRLSSFAADPVCAETSFLAKGNHHIRLSRNSREATTTSTRKRIASINHLIVGHDQRRKSVPTHFER